MAGNPHQNTTYGNVSKNPNEETGGNSYVPRPGSNGPSGNGGKKGSIDLGGLFSSIGNIFGGKKQAKLAEENRKWQEQQNTLAYERTLPWSSQGPAGNVEFDPETKQMIQSLSPEYQQMMEGWLGTSGMANQELQGMMGDPYAMEQQQFQRFEDLNANAYAQSRMQGEEAALATGRMGGTQGYYDKLATEGAISKDRLGGQMNAMRTGMDYRNMLKAESLGFGGGAQNVAGMLNPQAQLGAMVGQNANTTGNMAGVSTAGSNYADTKSGFWSGMTGQAAQYNRDGSLATGATTGWGDNLKGAFSSLFTQPKNTASMFPGGYK